MGRHRPCTRVRTSVDWGYSEIPNPFKGQKSMGFSKYFFFKLLLEYHYKIQVIFYILNIGFRKFLCSTKDKYKAIYNTGNIMKDHYKYCWEMPQLN